MNDATRATDVANAALLALGAGAVAPAQATDAELAAAALPADHPAWQRDVVALSQRVRAILATLQPVVVKVVAIWDHAVRSVRIGPRCIEVDPSGSYRLR